MPIEVLVVDNNCNDKTIAIAQKYSFVRVLKESRQGQVFAQASGFNVANGNLLGRIDADSVLPPDWVERVTAHFADNSKTVALTGSSEPYDLKPRRAAALLFNSFHAGVAHIFTGQVMLWGSNCAIRRPAWQKIKAQVAYRTDVWEDFDMSFLLNKYGRVEYLKKLRVACSYHSGLQSIGQQVSYQYRAVRTVKLHLGWLRSNLFFIAWFSLLFFAPAVATARFFNRRTSSSS